jgi:phosphoenolpyruvate carboxylase
MSKYKVPKTMSTQHPDNVATPVFADNPELGGEDEIKEAFYAYSHIKCEEQLWDCEGKETDNYVVKKLLTSYEPFFKKNKLGKDLFLTLRVPNPTVEKTESKILLETLESIPRNFDTASLFYGEDIAPIFEIALPMATNVEELLMLSRYYKKHVIGKKHSKLQNKKISQWLGDFQPEHLRIIPLFEDKESMLSSDKIVEKFIKEEKVKDYQRVWLARSDPALNYGSLACVLTEKIALQRLHKLEQKTSIDILPILGCGSAPFRGNLRPDNASLIVEDYPSVHTYTLQSAFKYDSPITDVQKAVEFLNKNERKEPTSVDDKKCQALIEKQTKEYQKQVALLAPLINDISSFIPSRRKRKLHIGLFGYSRSMGKIKLPRAIKFCGALHSIGIPPEILGLNALSQKDFDYIEGIYPSFSYDLGDSLKFLNKDTFKLLAPKVYSKLKDTLSLVDYEEDQKHKKITSIIVDNYRKKQPLLLSENIVRAGFIRGFLG